MSYLFEGAISVKAALLAEKRKVNQIWVDENKKDKDIRFIISQAKNRGVSVLYKKREEIDEIAQGNSHGGIICFTEDRRYETVKDLKGKKFLAILEGIEDPFNFGYCLRSLYAAGCEGVLVNQRNWYESAGVIAKSSAGASEYLLVTPVEDWHTILTELKEEYCIIAAQRKDAINLYDADLTKPFILAIGGERRGLSRMVNDMADINVYIPYPGSFRNALNASSAVSVIAFEYVRQTLKRG